MCKSVLIGLCFGGVLGWAAERGQVIHLWERGAPGSEARAQEPERDEGPDAVKNFPRVSNIHNPSIAVYLPGKEKATGVGIVVAPGGGHQFLVVDKEGTEIAAWLNRNGIAAFVLKYRLAREQGSQYTVERDAFADSTRTLRMVRSRAGEWGLDASKIGIMGFSAGGEVAALAETRFDNGNAQSDEVIERASSRPDFAVVVYPGFRKGEITVPANAPPAFLVCADDDRSHVVTTVELYLALEAAKIPAELHVYTRGGHGFGIRDVHAPVSTWTDRLLDWMVDERILAHR